MPKQDTLVCTVFDRVKVGQVFKQNSDYDGCFIRIAERPNPLCMCKVGYNAINVNPQPFFVHYCLDRIVKVGPGSTVIFAHLLADKDE